MDSPAGKHESQDSCKLVSLSCLGPPHTAKAKVLLVFDILGKELFYVEKDLGRTMPERGFKFCQHSHNSATSGVPKKTFRLIRRADLKHATTHSKHHEFKTHAHVAKLHSHRQCRNKMLKKTFCRCAHTQNWQSLMTG